MRRTTSSLHHALIGLAHEKPYPAIAVKEILDRANVGKSTFYTHFRDKDDLLESGIHEVLRSVRNEPHPHSVAERIVAFSLPLLAHIDEHRRAAGPKMRREGRAIMHAHLEDVLTALVADDLETAIGHTAGQMLPTDLLARHIASAFVLVLNWWVETESALTPTEIDTRFRKLVMPMLRSETSG